MPNLNEIQFDLKTVAAIVMTVVTGLGVFWGVKTKLDIQAETIAALCADVAAMKAKQEEVNLNLNSLTVTLRAKGVMQ
jgi:hypothetical protein